ncbi:hypothetical protein MES5069_270135 [Mesorhizobium escarrei]|uniref:ATP-binding protein n=1 Tax=Mesorhizobium escarrei TaxID=666018 RepID=A0ABN8JS35_9HYPH|nr:hypothetical protein MES5069_270135 [Mesorhizobium escarrei]
MEEAHRYIGATPSRYAVDSTKGFERIAKEGRKYGIFIVLASQRPSELSKTVLSQCSNFVVHRIQNPDDLSRRFARWLHLYLMQFLNAFHRNPSSTRPRSDGTKIVDLWFHEVGRRIFVCRI